MPINIKDGLFSKPKRGGASVLQRIRWCAPAAGRSPSLECAGQPTMAFRTTAPASPPSPRRCGPRCQQSQVLFTRPAETRAALRTGRTRFPSQCGGACCKSPSPGALTRHKARFSVCQRNTNYSIHSYSVFQVRTAVLTLVSRRE